MASGHDQRCWMRGRMHSFESASPAASEFHSDDYRRLEVAWTVQAGRFNGTTKTYTDTHTHRETYGLQNESDQILDFGVDDFVRGRDRPCFALSGRRQW